MLDITSKDEFSNLLIEQSTLLNDASNEIHSVMENVKDIFNEFSKVLKQNKKEASKLIKEFECHCSHIKEYINHIHVEITALVDVVKGSEQQLSENQKTVDDLKRELEDQKKQNIEFKNKYIQQLKITNEIKEQFKIQQKATDDLKIKCDQLDEEYCMSLAYSAATGAVLSKMVWKTSKSRESIQTYIDTGTLNHFLNLANRTITSFGEVYKDVLPEVETYEFQFLQSLFGVCVNIMAQNFGREFVLERNSGRILFENIITYLGNVPMPSTVGPLIKRMILMLIYNLTFTNQGTYLIESFENSVDNIIKCFNRHHTAEIHSIAVMLLNQLMIDARTKGFRLKVKKKLSQNENDFKMLMNTADDKTKDFCTQLITQIQELNDNVV